MTKTFGPWIDSNAPWFVRAACFVFGHVEVDGPRVQVCDRCHGFRRRQPVTDDAPDVELDELDDDDVDAEGRRPKPRTRTRKVFQDKRHT